MTNKKVRNRKRGRMLAMALVGAAGLGFAGPSIADQMGKLAKELADLRGEVETLSQELSSKQTDLQNELKSYARQKAELEAELQREKIRLEKVRQAILEKTNKVAAQEQNDKAMRPGFETSVGKVRSYVSATMPFRQGERLSELDKIEEQYKTGLLSPERAIARLWAFLEDEFRLTNESGIFRQTVAVDGKEQLADVVRVGMMMLFFRTADGQYGNLEKTAGGEWKYQGLNGKENVERIEGLFEAFRKQIRVGYFEVPPAIANKGAN